MTDDAVLATDLARRIALRLLAALDRGELQFAGPRHDPAGGWTRKTPATADLDCRVAIRAHRDHPFVLLLRQPPPVTVWIDLAPHQSYRPWSPGVHVDAPLPESGPLRQLVERLFLPPDPASETVAPDDVSRTDTLLDTFLREPSPALDPRP